MVRRALASPVPPPRKASVRVVAVLEPWRPTIDAWLAADLPAPRKQRHTARRVWQRLVEEQGADVGESTVRRYVAECRRRQPVVLREVMVPQAHPLGEEAEVDFGNVTFYLNGLATEGWLFVMRLSEPPWDPRRLQPLGSEDGAWPQVEIDEGHRSTRSSYVSRAVRMVLEVRQDTGQSFGVITRVARELGIGSESLRKWVHQADIDGGASPGTSTVDARRLSELERDNRDNPTTTVTPAPGSNRCRDNPASTEPWALQTASTTSGLPPRSSSRRSYNRSPAAGSPSSLATTHPRRFAAPSTASPASPASPRELQHHALRSGLA